MHDLIFVPTILFLIFVAPIWVVMHYRYKSKMVTGLSESEQGNIDEMLESLDKMSQRIETLESILDGDHSGWRQSKRKEAGDE